MIEKVPPGNLNRELKTTQKPEIKDSQKVQMNRAKVIGDKGIEKEKPLEPLEVKPQEQKGWRIEDNMPLVGGILVGCGLLGDGSGAGVGVGLFIVMFIFAAQNQKR